MKKKLCKILAFQNNGAYISNRDDKNGTFYVDEGDEMYSIYTLDQMLGRPEWQMYSVQRLKDNVIFTIGDLIVEGREYSQIKSFYEANGDIYLKISPKKVTNGPSNLIMGVSIFHKVDYTKAEVKPPKRSFI
jgi:hypothetical protein